MSMMHNVPCLVVFVMGKFAQIVMGPAGSGKSTYCHAIATHAAEKRRMIHILNLDPAAEELPYEPAVGTSS